MTWFRCIGSNGGGDSKTVVRYASFNGSGYITLPYTVSADYKITVDYYIPKYVDNMAIIGSTSGSLNSTYSPHLTLFSNKYYTGAGTSEANFVGSTVGRHNVIINTNNKVIFDGIEVANYTPVDGTNVLTIGFRDIAPNKFVGKIYEYKIESISTGDIICHIKPIKYQGELVFRDIINGINYSCSGMCVIEEPDYGELDSYIASSGQQYIALPLYSDDYPVIKTKMMLGYLPGTQQALWGDIWDVNSFMLYAENGAFSFRYTTNNVDVITPKYWEWVDVELDYTNGTFLYGDTIYGGIPKTQLHNQIYLFGLPSGRDGWCAYSTIEVYKNGILYMNLEPRLDKETNAGYYYDTINNIPYYSSTSSPLVYEAMSSDGGGGIIKSSLTLKYSSGTAGTETYTITENAKYMIINAWSWQDGTGTKGTTTLPSGRIPIIDEEILNTSIFGYKLTIADLQIGDIVTITNYLTNPHWLGNTKLIFKMNNINPTSLIYQTTAGDGWINVSSITGSGKALFIGMCIGGSSPTPNMNIVDQSIINSNNYDYEFATYVDTNCIVRITYCSISEMPHYRMYGYDGGFAGLAVIQ